MNGLPDVALGGGQRMIDMRYGGDTVRYLAKRAILSVTWQTNGGAGCFDMTLDACALPLKSRVGNAKRRLHWQTEQNEEHKPALGAQQT